MADLLSKYNNLFLPSLSSNSSSSLLPFPPFSLYPRSSTTTLRFRRFKLSHHSSLIAATLSPDSSRLDIVSTSENSDGSVVFKFGDASEIVDNVGTIESTNDDDDDDESDDAKLEIVGASNDDDAVDGAKSQEVVAGSSSGELDVVDDAKTEVSVPSNDDDDDDDDEHELKLERECVSSDAKELETVEESDSIEVEDSIDSEPKPEEIPTETIVNNAGELVELSDKSDEISSDSVVESQCSSVDSELESKESLVESILSTDSVVDSQCGAQSGGDTVENELNRSFISTEELEEEPSAAELMKYDEEDNGGVIITSDSVTDSVVEDSSDREEVNNGVDVEALVTVGTTSSGVGLVMESSEDMNVAEIVPVTVPVLSASQLELEDKESLPVDETSLCLDAIETADRELDIVVAKGNESDELIGVTETNSHVEASVMSACLEDRELDSNVRHGVNEENDEMMSLETAESDSCGEASVVAESLEDSELDNNVRHGINEENDGMLSLETTESDSCGEASVVAVSLEDSELDGVAKDVVNEVDDSFEVVQETAQVEADPILDEEVSLESVDTVVASESTSEANVTQLEVEPVLNEEATSSPVDDVAASESSSDFNVVNDVVLPAITKLNDERSSNSTLEAKSPEESEITLEEATHDSETSVDLSLPTVSLSSAAALLPHPSEVLAGREDAYFICQNWLGVADGVGQWTLEGRNEGQYGQDLMQSCEKLALTRPSAGLTDFKEVVQKSAQMVQSNGLARVLIAHFGDQVLHVANIGDSGFIIIRNGSIFRKSSPMVHEFGFPYAISSGDDPLEVAQEYHVKLEDGDVIITATDGLFDNLYEQEIASVVAKSLEAGMEPKDLAELLAAKAQEVGRSPMARSPFADAAQAAGHPGFNGGKLDHVTVIVSLVKKR